MSARGIWSGRLRRCCLCGIVFSGCLGSRTPQQATTFSAANKHLELSCAREGAERVDVASWRGSGRPDVVRVYTRVPSGESRGQTVLSCREVDLNGDGRKDMLVYYDLDGRKQREEFDHDYDGIADVKSFYEAGRLVRQELDINHDGKADMVQYFAGDKLLRVERLSPEAEGDAKPAAADKAAPSVPEQSGRSAKAAAGS